MLFFVFAACSPDPGHDSTAGAAGGDSADSGVAPYPLAEVNLEALATGALRLTFDTAEPLRARATFDNGEGRPRETVAEDEPTLSHELVLVGVAQGTAFDWTVELQDDTGVIGAATGSGTGTTLAEAPAFTSTVSEAAADGLTLVSAVKAQTPWVLLLDESGRTVWAYALQLGSSSVTAPRLARDGQSILMNSQSPSVTDSARISRVTFAGEESVIAEGNGLHIDFAERPDGVIVALGWELKSFGDRTLLGDTILLLDGNDATTLWSAFDQLPVDLTRTYDANFYVPDPTVEDWSHVNGLSLEPETGDILATMTIDDGVMRVDGTTGATEWRFTSNDTGTVSTRGQRITNLPHWVQWLGDGHVLVFNRGDRFVDNNVCSDITDIDVDTENGWATAGWSYTSADCAQSAFRGAAKRLENGNTIIDYSSLGLLQEVDGEGQVLRTVQAPVGWEFGFVDHTAALP